ncbi:hypothetical protein LNTAR_04191 [Lentisphaera araneosa HTCC2155]|uniref:Uncharacterized protein n=1 Tax=Lentisphaera araneosa HTCC2155 TaxID=313628 RepID=A6DTY4_9BACT|nr:hypothetical protein [Lentisphaera araneosa]EDM24900.1 hypothetical protein LNTAR_04191 [Lentisphaera araneosa HTCC2155]
MKTLKKAFWFILNSLFFSQHSIKEIQDEKLKENKKKKLKENKE